MSSRWKPDLSLPPRWTDAVRQREQLVNGRLQIELARRFFGTEADGIPRHASEPGRIANGWELVAGVAKGSGSPA